MVFVTEIVTETEVGTRKRAIVVVFLTMLVLKECGIFLRLWTRKVVECSKHGLMWHPRKSTEDSSTENGGMGSVFE